MQVIAAAKTVSDFADTPANGTVVISHGEEMSEKYTLTINENGVIIYGDSAAGAFYGIQTLKQLLQQGNRLPYVEIHDAPEFTYRGFYHDVSRGRIPTLETLKKLVDKLALYKMNSLQLYVEHTFAFREYVQANEGQEPLTAEEIRELDAYCRERFVDLVPSLSCFGHLYALLEQDEYKHLCELENYQPTTHLWWERMRHHTLDPENPDSFALVQSLIDQYLPLFSSHYFNICCDETFDLGKGKSAGKDIGQVYTAFVSRLISYVESCGKTAMLWGDIVLKHMERVADISPKAILLNWDYNSDTPFTKVKRFEQAGKQQIVCPGTNGWGKFVEDITVSENNIRRMSIFGKLCDAQGVLNTNWGDFGHLCDPANAAFGLILGAAEAWNPGGADNDYFDKAVSILNYQNDNGKVIEVLRTMGNNNDNLIKRLLDIYVDMSVGKKVKPEGYDEKLYISRAERYQVARKLLEEERRNGTIEEESAQMLIYAAWAYELLYRGIAIYCGDADELDWKVSFELWITAYAEDWKQKNKPDELPILEEFFNTFKHCVLGNSK